MKPNAEPYSGWRLPAGLSIQLLVSHTIAAAVAMALARSGQVALGLAAAAAAGLILTLSLQRSLWLVFRALASLNAGQLPARLSTRWHGPLGRLIFRVNDLIAREREVQDLRKDLLRQAGESAAQQERNRLARELHDSIKQQIFGISLSAAAVQARWESDAPGAREALSDVQRSAEEAMVEMNALLQQLSPAPLEKVGLRQALREQCEALGYRTGAEVKIEFGDLPDDDRLPPGAQEGIFRIAQEALSNVARHARATQVHLYLGQCEAGGHLVLEIRDDGRGFAKDAVPEGMGLENIQQRVQALAGELTVDSAPGEGTRLCVSVPILEPAVPLEEGSTTYRQDHTLNRTFLAGLAGGLVLITVLFYPLYVLLPGHFVAGWPTGSAALGFVMEIAAVPLMMAAGFITARWIKAETRQAGTLLGALAGSVAGAVLHFGIGAAAAGVAGNAALFKHGLAPAGGNADAVRLLSEAATGIAWCLFGTFWATLLAGTGLGAIGGWLAPPATGSQERSGLRLTATTILAASILVSALSFAYAVLIFVLLESAISESIVSYGMHLNTNLPVAGISLWPIGTSLVLYLGSLAVHYLFLRSETATKDPAQLGAVQDKAALFGLVALLVPGFLLVVSPDWIIPSPTVRALAAVTIACSLPLGGLHLKIIFEVRRRRHVAGRGRRYAVQAMAIATALLSLAAIAWAAALPSALSLVVAVAVVAADVGLIVLVRRQPPSPPPDAAALARSQLWMSQSINAALGTVVAIVVPLMAIASAMISGITIMLRFAPVLSDPGTAGQPYVPDFTSADLVRDAYSTQAQAFLLVFAGAAALVGLLLLIASIQDAIARRRSRPRAVTVR